MSEAASSDEQTSVESTAGLFDRYWRKRMQSAEQRLDAALDLINHNPTRGTLAEEALRAVVKAFLPGQWATASGFVLGHQSRLPSRQIDILLYDQLAGTPIYSDENIVVLSSGRPGIAIEVKSELNKKSFTEAMENVASFKSCYEGASGINASIYAYRGFAKSETLREHLAAHTKNVDPTLWPDLVCVQATRMVVTRGGDNRQLLRCQRCDEPVVQSLLTNVLNALGVPGTKEFLPEPKLGDQLFEIRRGEQ